MYSRHLPIIGQYESECLKHSPLALYEFKSATAEAAELAIRLKSSEVPDDVYPLHSGFIRQIRFMRNQVTLASHAVDPVNF